MITFIYPADTITGKGDEGESVYSPTFEGMSPQISDCANGEFPPKSSCFSDLIHTITWELLFRSLKQKGLVFSQNYNLLGLARADCFRENTF